jgi:hypothetical protein
MRDIFNLRAGIKRAHPDSIIAGSFSGKHPLRPCALAPRALARGGWTAHFTWKTRPEETCLDVFGIAPRASSAWENEIAGIYHKHLRPFTSAVRRAIHDRGGVPKLTESHEIRVACALLHLPQTPLRDYGLAGMLDEAKRNTAGTMGHDVVNYLPESHRNFFGL